MKVICVGYPKTGTKSMRYALDILGYENVHDVMEQFAFDGKILSKAMIDKTATRKDFKEAYSDVDAVMDLPGFLLWREIIDAFPNVKIVLMVRDNADIWLKSFRNLVQLESQFLPFRYFNLFQFILYNKLARLFCPGQYLASRLRAESYRRFADCHPAFKTISFERVKALYMQHNDLITDFCKKHNKDLLVFNAKEGWEPLCKFLCKDIPNVPFPKRNVNHSLFLDAVNGKTIEYDAGFIRKGKYEMLKVITMYFCLIILTVALFW